MSFSYMEEKRDLAARVIDHVENMVYQSARSLGTLFSSFFLLPPNPSHTRTSTLLLLLLYSYRIMSIKARGGEIWSLSPDRGRGSRVGKDGAMEYLCVCLVCGIFFLVCCIFHGLQTRKGQ
jgi:hypothetical protein